MTTENLGRTKDISNEETLHDDKLVFRFKNGEQSAFNEIVIRYREKLFGIAFNLLKNRPDAEEIAQDALMRAYRGLANFRGDSSLSSWLFMITTNLARNRYWYNFRRRRQDSVSIDCLMGEDSNTTLGECIASNAQSPSQQIVLSEFEAMVSNCIRKLSWSHREILELRMLEHRTYEYISQALCVNVGTVKSRIARARVSLLSIMSSSYPELAGDDLAKSLIVENAKGVVVAA